MSSATASMVGGNHTPPSALSISQAVYDLEKMSEDAVFEQLSDHARSLVLKFSKKLAAVASPTDYTKAPSTPDRIATAMHALEFELTKPLGRATIASSTPVVSHQAGRQLYSSSQDGFVRRSKHAEEDDPFGPSTSSRGQTTRSNGSSPSSRRGIAHTSSNWRNGSASSGSAAVSPAQVVDGQVTTPVTAENSQSHFLPSACVFVANLLSSAEDQSLEVAVTRAFRQFGHVYVKIRRDKRNMPFAFCQFTSDTHADRAVEEGKGIPIFGRPCRTERSKPNMSYFMHRCDGLPLSIEEGQKELLKHGTVQSIRKYNMPPYEGQNGLHVEYAYVDHGKLALNALRESKVYNFEQIPKETSTPSVHVLGARQQEQNRQYLLRYGVDRRSIFVGNLPSHVTEQTVGWEFGSFGIIVSVQTFRRPSEFVGGADNIFAFVEYSDDIAAMRALVKNNTLWDGNYLKVFAKDSDRSSRNTSNCGPVQADFHQPNGFYQLPPPWNSYGISYPVTPVVANEFPAQYSGIGYATPGMNPIYHYTPTSSAYSPYGSAFSPPQQAYNGYGSPQTFQRLQTLAPQYSLAPVSAQTALGHAHGLGGAPVCVPAAHSEEAGGVLLSTENATN